MTNKYTFHLINGEEVSTDESSMDLHSFDEFNRPSICIVTLDAEYEIISTDFIPHCMVVKTTVFGEMSDD